MVAAAIFVIEIDDVFVARIASGPSCADRSPNIFCFRSNFSETAYPASRRVQFQPLFKYTMQCGPRTSITISTSLKAEMPLLPSITVILSRASLASMSWIFPLDTSFAKSLSMSFSPLPICSSERSCSRTGTLARSAATYAIPSPTSLCKRKTC